MAIRPPNPPGAVEIPVSLSTSVGKFTLLQYWNGSTFVTVSNGGGGSPGPEGPAGPQGPAGTFAPIKTAAITVPRTRGGRFEHTETVADADVSVSSVLSAYLAPHSDTDENSAEMLSLQTLTATAGTSSVTFNLTFSRKEAGIIKLNYLRG